MPTIIDALVITLGLDPSKYTEGSKKYRDEDRRNRDTAEQSAKKIAEANKRQAESFASIKREALGLFATLVGAKGIEQYVASTVAGYNAIGQAAKQAGINVRDFAAFGNMVAKNGGNADQARASLSNLAAVMTRFRTLGQLDPEHARVLSKIGAGANDDPVTLYQKFASWAGTQKDPTLVRQEGSVLGFDQASIDLAMKGRATVDKELESAKKRAAIDEENAKKAQAAQAAFVELQQAVKKNADEMLMSVLPGLTALVEQTGNLVRAFPELTKAAIAAALALFALSGVKTVGGVLGLGSRTAGGAAAGVAGRGLLGGLAAWAGGAITAMGGAAVVGPLAGIAAALIPTQANKGENEAMARYRSEQTNSRAAHIKARLIAMGWTEAQANGMLAGMIAENNTLDPSRLGPVISKTGHRAYGIGQWLGKRADQLHAMYGAKPTMDQQLDFLQWEYQHTEQTAAGAIRSSKDSRSAMVAYLSQGMRPGDGLAGDIRRGDAALGRVTSIQVQQMTVQLPGVKNAEGFTRELPRAVGSDPRVTNYNSGLN